MLQVGRLVPAREREGNVPKSTRLHALIGVRGNEGRRRGALHGLTSRLEGSLASLLFLASLFLCSSLLALLGTASQVLVVELGLFEALKVARSQVGQVRLADLRKETV